MKLSFRSSSVFLLLVIQFILAAAASAHAKGWEKIPSTDFALPPPPNRQQTEREVETLLQLQQERTAAECDLGQKEKDTEFTDLFDHTSLLTKSEIKTLAPLFTRVSKLGERVAGYFKTKYRRTRPYDFDSRIQPCIKMQGGAKSYPSSHAAVATLDACVLAAIFPKYGHDFLALGVELSERRMRVGVHFPSDVKAGQDLGDAICQRLNAEDDFNQEIGKIRKAL